MMRSTLLLTILGIFLVSCGGGDDTPSIPEAAQLIFPEQNSECTTGVSVNDELSQVTFEWQASNNTETYTLQATNLNTNMLQTITTGATSASISIAKGTPYSWSITSRNSQSNESATSETWLFYNSGSQTTYAPFPAQLVSPTSGSTVVSDDGSINLDWIGADVENDITGYEVFFSEENPPTNSVGTPDAFSSEFAVSVSPNTVYFWRVITRDTEGNTSDSGVFEFKTF